MALPLIAKGLARLAGLYARWRGADFAIDAVDGGDSAGLTSIRTDMPSSSAIDWIEYNPISAKLLVRFRNRPRHPTYVYSSVPRLVWLGWLRAGSKGVYYHRSVKQHSDIIG